MQRIMTSSSLCLALTLAAAMPIPMSRSTGAMVEEVRAGGGPAMVSLSSRGELALLLPIFVKGVADGDDQVSPTKEGNTHTVSKWLIYCTIARTAFCQRLIEWSDEIIKNIQSVFLQQLFMKRLQHDKVCRIENGYFVRHIHLTLLNALVYKVYTNIRTDNAVQWTQMWQD